MTKEEIISLLIQNKEILYRYKVGKLGLFGSFARGKAKKRSDVDLLVEFRETIGLFEYVHLIDDISKILNRKVDLVTPNALKPIMKQQVLDEVEWIEGL
jgi:uncharacterized protein